MITHLPPIAAHADHHITIAKRPKGGIATADVSVLEGDARVQEVARMLGDQRNPVVVEHAEGATEAGRRIGGQAVRRIGG